MKGLVRETGRGGGGKDIMNIFEAATPAGRDGRWQQRVSSAGRHLLISGC